MEPWVFPGLTVAVGFPVPDVCIYFGWGNGGGGGGPKLENWWYGPFIGMYG